MDPWEMAKRWTYPQLYVAMATLKWRGEEQQRQMDAQRPQKSGRGYSKLGTVGPMQSVGVGSRMRVPARRS